MSRAVRVLAAATIVAAFTATVATAGPTTRHSIPSAGASIATPSSWKALDARIVTNPKVVKEFVAHNPALRPFVDQMTGPGSVIKLMVFDLKVTNGFATNVNVVVSGSRAGVTLGQIATVYATQLKTVLPTLKSPVATRIVALPAGKAIRASYRVGFAIGGREVVVQTLQYLLLHGGKTIVVTFSTLPGQASARAATFTAIARSLRFS
jgi:hypothetical protein